MLYKKGSIPWNKGMKVDRKKYPNMGSFGKRSLEFCKRRSEIAKKVTPRGKYNYMWVGDKIQYRGLHNWVELKLGKPNECWLCDDKRKHRYHWANIGEYIRDLSNWYRLCPKCHKHIDIGRRVMAYT